MANASPNNERRYFGEFPEPTLPTLPQPPEIEVLAAMRDVPPLFASNVWVRGRVQQFGGEPLHFLGGRLSENGHSEPAEQWAIHRLVLAGLLTVKRDGQQALVAPEPTLFAWWRNGEDAPALTKEAASVLLYLADQAPVLSSLDDIESKAGLSRSRAKGACDELIGKEFAHRPEGQNKGIAATSSGLAIANKLSTKSAQT